MAEQAQDRQLPASERKIRKAREDGQVARSRDLGHLAALGTGMLLLVAAAPMLAAWLQRLLAQGLTLESGQLAHPAQMSERLLTFATDMLVVVLPFGVIVAAACVVSAIAAGGWNFSMKPMAPTFSKLNPIPGLARMFSGHQLVDALKACVLALAVGGVGVLYFRSQIPALVALASTPLLSALAVTFDAMQGVLGWVLLVLLAFALVDVPLQRQMLMRRLRMSAQEQKQENKETQGSGAVKTKMRARMREMASRRMMAAVPKADLVVMNPTHYAVALKYDEASMGAPRVVAKGADLTALRIRDVAAKAGVPVLQAPPLARALYAHTEVDQEIPAALFSAVAQVLAWVFQLRQAGAMRSVVLASPPMPFVPPELDPQGAEA